MQRWPCADCETINHEMCLETMRTLGKRRESTMTALATGALLAEGARFSESISWFAKTTFVPKGVYRYKSHEAADQHQLDCLVAGIGRLAAERA